MSAQSKGPLLDVDDLRVTFPTRTGLVQAVRGVTFSLGRERLGIVGESGSGKSQTGRAIMGLTAPQAEVSAKKLSFDGIDLLSIPSRQRRALRGNRIAMILQDPKYSLDPVMSIGRQIVETLRTHERVSRAEARERALAMLEALDVTVQLDVLNILDRLVAERGMGLIFISHDLRLVSSFCDRVIVMYAGKVVEQLKASELRDARHPYTRGLLNCMPRIGFERHPLPVLDRKPEWAA
ncbi:MAG: ABC transporter ATP-binding protein [Mesorhizobium sp.]|nr:MAG: ABC transporter ATP-binding protein [Mesorhizobium sp.]